MRRVFLCVCGFLGAFATQAQDIPAPEGSVLFGLKVVILPNGNTVVVDQNYDPPGSQNAVGAVYLYRPDRSLISRLTGTQTGDRVGAGGIVLLPGGNFLVISGNWDNGGAVDAGAVTFVNGTTGLNGEVTAANSLVGSSAGDRIGAGGVDILSNGNYVVVSPDWNNNATPKVGAVTWGSGTQGVVGAVSALNSLIGASANDGTGNTNGSSNNGVFPLSNGHYVVSTPSWDHGAVADVGAVTWANGNGGTVGMVSAANSLIGSTAGDAIGSRFGTDSFVVALSNGHYVVPSRRWDQGSIADVGAVTWCDGTQPTSAQVSSANSLTGSNSGDQVGERVVALTNGHYMVASSRWDSFAFVDAGALTWRSGNGAFPATVSRANSLVGLHTSHRVGGRALAALTNGHFVFSVSGLDTQSSLDARGAVVWVDGNLGANGPISSQVGLVGSTTLDNVGSGLYALPNGHYVVTSPMWTNGSVVAAGAVTWRNGNGPSSGIVSPANSLVGSTAYDRVGLWGVVVLNNGNYVATTPDWTRGTVAEAGAVTWGNGLGGTVGAVSVTNSLVGSTFQDRVGEPLTVHALTDGNYVVASRYWDSSVVNAGAVTWGNGSVGQTGSIDASNSLVGTTAEDQVGLGILVLPDGRYAVDNPLWDEPNLGIPDARAVTLGRAGGSTIGPVNEANSLLIVYLGAAQMSNVDWDPARERLAIGRGPSVSFFSYEALSFDGFE